MSAEVQDYLGNLGRVMSAIGRSPKGHFPRPAGLDEPVRRPRKHHISRRRVPLTFTRREEFGGRARHLAYRAAKVRAQQKEAIA